jgi:hypothetical protein
MLNISGWVTAEVFPRILVYQYIRAPYLSVFEQRELDYILHTLLVLQLPGQDENLGNEVQARQGE